MLSWMLWDQQIGIYTAIRELPPSISQAVILCARQFGKTFLIVLMAIEDCLRHPNTSTLVVGPNIKQTNAIISPKVRELMRLAPPGLIRPSKSEGKWYVGDSDLIMGGFDQKSSDRGKSVHGIYIEETVDSHPDQYNESLKSDLSPAMTHSKGGRIIFATTLPKIPDHPFITDTIPKARLRNAFYSFTIDDNIALSQEQYDRCIEEAGGKDSPDCKREYFNIIIRDKTKVIIPTFDAAKHVRAVQLPNRAFWQITVDFGGVKDKTCAILHYYDYLADTDVVWDEVIHDPNTDTSIIVKSIFDLEERWGLKLVRGEPPYLGQMFTGRIIDCPGQIFIDLHQLGMQCNIPDKNDWLANIHNVVVRYGENKLLVHPRCRFVIESCQSGTFNKRKTDFERTEALGHCDGIAALMYGIRTRRIDSPWGSAPMTDYRAQNQIIRPTTSETMKIAAAMTKRR